MMVSLREGYFPGSGAKISVDLVKKISHQMLIPHLFGHLLEPADRIGSHTFLLFGPPGTGKTLFAQSLAQKHGIDIFLSR